MILIVDNGSQYTHLIMRTCRDMDYDSVIVNNSSSYERSVEPIEDKIQFVILSGGPGSVYSGNNGLSEDVAKRILKSEKKWPLFGICFGHQVIALAAGAQVGRGKSAEYGISEIIVDKEDRIFKDMPKRFNAWVSHFDEVKSVPDGFMPLAHSESCGIEAMRHKEREIYSVQFHPEVWHTEYGERIIENFLEDPDELANI
jgi:GMP synthase (glutamine-hydrolysing)